MNRRRFPTAARGRAWLLCLIALLAACAPAARVPAQEGTVRLPSGFRMETFASGLGAPRFMAVSPSGDLFVSVPSRGQILALPDRDGDGRADRAVVYANGLNRPHGLAFFRGFLYVAETDAVVRLLLQRVRGAGSAPPSFSSIRMGRAAGSSPGASGTPSASASTRRRGSCGRRTTEGTGWGMTSRRIRSWS